MQTNELKFSRQVKEDEVLKGITQNYTNFVTDFFEFQRVWFYSCYNLFNDIDKYFILAYLFRRQFESYSNFLINKSYEEFYSIDKFEIEKFNIIDVSKELNFKKETTRRKIIELEKSGIIQKSQKRVILNKKAAQIQKPVDSINSLSRVISNITKFLVKNETLELELSTNEISKILKNNFTTLWKDFLNFQIGYMIRMQKLYDNDLESFLIAGMIFYNQHISTRVKAKQNTEQNFYKYSFTKNLTESFFDRGISAMSISEMTGIPRPTVLRKLNKFLKKNFLIKDKSSLYRINDKSNFLMDIDKVRLINLEKFNFYITKIINLTEISLKRNY